MHNSFKTKTHDFPWGKTGGGGVSRAVSHLHLSSPDLLWILWKRLELIVVKAGYPSSLAPATKKHRGETEKRFEAGTFFFRFYGSESRMILMGHKCPHWDLYKCPVKQPKRKSWDKHLGRVSFGFNGFSHLGQDSQHLLCKKYFFI